MMKAAYLKFTSCCKAHGDTLARVPPINERALKEQIHPRREEALAYSILKLSHSLGSYHGRKLLCIIII